MTVLWNRLHRWRRRFAGDGSIVRGFTKRSAAAGMGLAITATVTVGTALAASAVLPGYYYTLPLKSTPSTAFSFDVNPGGNVAYINLACGPVSSRIESILRHEHWANIEVRVPRLKLDKANGFSYDGPASINGRPWTKRIGATTLQVTVKHVDGPTITYKSQGQTQTATRSFIGTATSPACITTKIKQDPAGTPLYRAGQFQLYY